MPVRETCCALPEALSVSVIAPVRVPVAFGLNVTFTVQDDPAARLDPQLFVCAKSPLELIEVKFVLTLLVLVTVRVCAALVVFNTWPLKVRLDADSDKVGVGVGIPVPARVICCGLPDTLSASASVPVRVPVAVGVNLT